MRRMKLIVCILLASLLTTRAAESSLPDLGHATVTIPYAELRALWEAGQRKPEPAKEPAPAPVAFVVHRAEIRLDLGETASTIEAAFDVETLDAKWQTIPLLGGDARLDKAEAGERAVIWDGGYVLLTNAAGKTLVALHLATHSTKQLGKPLILKLGSASVKRLTISGIPAGQEVRVNEQRAPANKDGIAIVHLPGEAGEVNIEIAAPKIEDAPQPITPSIWRTESQTLTRFSEGRLRFLSRVFARAEDGSGLAMTLALPPNAAAITVNGDDLADWTQARGDDGRRLVRIRWKTRDLLDREVALAYAVPQSPLADQWTLQAPATPDEKGARHLYAIVAANGLELKGDGLRAAVESRRLPEWMREDIGSAAFVTAEAGSQLVLQTHWLPTIATAEAIIGEAKAKLQLVSDGAMQISATYAIRHQAPLAWRLDLPSAVEILSCTVDGVAAQPIQRENGAIELSLTTPTKGQSSVAIVYTAKVKPLDPVSGELALELPRTPLFIERFDWSVSLPSAFEITTFYGAGWAATQASDEHAIALHKDFCRGERPAIALFYQRLGLEK